MDKTIRKLYTPPLVVQTADVLLERNLLGSVVENLIVETTSQEVEQVEMDTEFFNYKWE